MAAPSKSQSSVNASRAKQSSGRGFLWFFLVLAGVLFGQFLKSFDADYIVFSNDGPMGFLASAASRLPDAFFGFWQHLNWVGKAEASAAPNLSWGLLYLMGPIAFAKYYAPLALLFFGCCAWVYFRRVTPIAVVAALAAMAATLNSNIFSNVCWGLGARAIMGGWVFLALAALEARHDKASRLRWLLTGFSGAAIGMAVMEGYDLGAILSLYLAAFVVFLSWLDVTSMPSDQSTSSSLMVGVTKGAVSQLVVIVVCAGLVAAHALTTLVSTQIKGVAKAEEAMGGVELKTPEQRAAEKEANWNFATQWSLPKIETLRVVVPGLYGYRMDPGTNTYWGRVGQTPGQPTSRYSGSGEYLGVFVFLVALWTFLRSLAGEGCPFDYRSRRIIWFWSAAAFVSLLLAWGRFAPFYQLLYPLPFFSNIRNPIKFTHPMHLSLGILFAYGLHALWHQYVADRKASEESWKATVDAWRRQLEGFDKGWALGMVISCVVAVLAFLIYASSRQQLETHLKAILWQGAPVAEIAAFSAGEVGWSVFFLVCSVLILVGFFSGLLAGQRAKVGVVLIGLLLVVDLGRANKPWIVFINKAVKYADNDVLKVLRDPPYEGRVTLPQFPVNPEVQPYFNVLAQVYGVEWVQHHFQYYGIQSLDVVQMPRPPRSYTRFNQMLRPGMSGATGTNYWNEALRYWKLTNTKYLLSLAAFAEGLNNQLAGGDAIFEEKVRFNFAQLPNGAIVTESTTNGPYALIENRSALPRVKLFSQWVSAPASAQDPDEWVLEQMREPDFDPASLVMVSSLSESAPTAGVGTEKGAAKIVRYAPKRVVVKAIARERSVLLLNDAYHPEWTVFVDGVEAPLLKCNYLMKGVLLEAGEHDVTFEYRPPAGSLYLSLASIMGCLGSFGWIVRRRRKG